jgi:hypothetical protein
LLSIQNSLIPILGYFLDILVVHSQIESRAAHVSRFWDWTLKDMNPYGQQNPYGTQQPGYGQLPQGQPQYGQQPPQQGGQNPYGTQQHPPQQHGQPPFSQQPPQGGQPQYGQQPHQGGQPQYGQQPNPYGTQQHPPQGQPQYGQPPQQQGGQPQPQYGQPQGQPQPQGQQNYTQTNQQQPSYTQTQMASTQLIAPQGWVCRMLFISFLFFLFHVEIFLQFSISHSQTSYYFNLCNAQEQQGLRQWFLNVDSDRSGYVDAGELQNSMKKS